MPSTCCVPGCKSNYPSSSEGSVRVFKFPNGEFKEKWMKAIPRSKWQPSDRSVVCIKHFKDEFIIKVDRIKKSDGTYLEIPRERYKLHPHAVPSIYPNLPNYLSNSKPASFRKDPTSRREEYIKREEEKSEIFINSDKVKSFQDLISHLPPMKSNWNVFSEDSRISYYRLQTGSLPLNIIWSFNINMDLTISIYYKNVKICQEKIKWLFTCNKENKPILQYYSQIDNLIAFLDNSDLNCVPPVTFEQLVEYINCYIKNNEMEEEAHISSVKFFHEQIILSSQNRYARRYSPPMLSWAFALYIKSPVCYKELYDGNILALPSVRYLRKLSSNFSLNTFSDSRKFDKYLKTKSGKLNHERIVNLLIDEVIVRPHINFLANSISGMSSNNNLAKAASVQAFMIDSVYSRYKDIVTLIPVYNLTARDLLSMTKSVIDYVQNSGFIIRAIISDNIQINRNMLAVAWALSHHATGLLLPPVVL